MANWWDGDAQAPRGNQRINNSNGTFSTERTITIGADGQFFNIPTIINGQQRTQAEAESEWRAGRNPEVGRFPTLTEALSRAQQRSDAIGANEWWSADAEAQEPKQPNTLIDMARSIPGGLAKGASAILGLPGDIQDAGAWLAHKTERMFDPETADRRMANYRANNPIPIPDSTDVSGALSYPTGGYYEPKTVAGQYTETAASFAPAAFVPGSAAARVARVAVPSVASETAGQLNKGTEAEPYARAIGGLAGGLSIPAFQAGRNAARALGGAGPTAQATAAHQAGFTLPPNSASTRPSLISQAANAWGGKIKTQQLASVKNQEVTNQIASDALSLPKGTPLTDATFKAVRKAASGAYDSVANSIPTIAPDAKFLQTAQSLGGRTNQAAQHFPGLVNNKEIDDLAKVLQATKDFPPQAGLEVVRHLRADATANLRNFADPAKTALGFAQRQAAEAIDELIERNLAAAGKADLVQNYREARQIIARSHDIEAVTNYATGDVNARGLAALANKGKPLTGGLRDIADAANAFPKAMQNPATFGGNENLSVLDMVGAAGSTMAGRPDIAALLLGRPLVRGAALSKPFQRSMMRAPAQPVPVGNEWLLPLLMLPRPNERPLISKAGAIAR